MLPFKFYTRKNAQTRFKRYCAYQNQYELINRNNRFLPFIITRATTSNQIISWRVYDLNDVLIHTINPATTGYEIYTDGSIQYLIYYGAQISGLTMACGSYYLKVSDNITAWYSEPFKVKDFTVDNNPYTTLEWKHNHDIGNIIYQTGYVNRLYLDIEIGEPDYNHEEEVEKNVVGEDADTLITNIKLYKTVIPSLPEFIVDSLTLSLHGSDDITLTLPNNEENIIVKQARVDPSWINDGCFANVLITFKVEEAQIHKTCDDNDELVEVEVTDPEAPIIVLDELINESGPGQLDGSFTVVVTNYSEPLYSLDNITFQSSGSFSGLDSGSYTVYVLSESGTTASLVVTVYENIDCSLYQGATIQDLIDDGITLGELYNCTLGDLQP